MLIFLPMPSAEAARERSMQEAQARADRRKAGTPAGSPWLVESDGSNHCIVLPGEDFSLLTGEELARVTRQLPPWLEAKRLLVGPGD